MIYIATNQVYDVNILAVVVEDVQKIFVVLAVEWIVVERPVVAVCTVVVPEKRNQNVVHRLFGRENKAMGDPEIDKFCLLESLMFAVKKIILRFSFLIIVKVTLI